jgi:hypothetical protein
VALNLMITTKTTTNKICPLGRQTVPDTGAPKLICSLCNNPIRRGQKFTHGPDHRPQHRNCENAEMAKAEPKQTLFGGKNETPIG